MPACPLAMAVASDTVNTSKTGSVPSNQMTRASEGRPNATHMPPPASVTAVRTSNARSIDQGILDMTIFPSAGQGGAHCIRFRLKTAWHSVYGTSRFAR